MKKHSSPVRVTKKTIIACAVILVTVAGLLYRYVFLRHPVLKQDNSYSEKQKDALDRLKSLGY